MENAVLLEKAKNALTLYLKRKGGRCTPERYKIVEVMAEMPSHFTIEELQQHMVETNFHVCRATLYNTVNELIDAHIVKKLLLGSYTRFEFCYGRVAHHHQVCKRCGRIKEFQSTELDAAVRSLHLKRFTMSEYSLCVYGICTSCVTQMRKLEKKNKTKK